MENWAFEKHDSMMYGFQFDKILYNKKSSIQEIKVVETEKYGKILFLDNCVMLTEKWEFIYHEMISHPVLFTHPKPEKVLIIGGGDGGTLREVLRHEDVERVDMVEIDEDVVEVSKKFFPEISREFNNPKANVIIDDGIKFIQNNKDEYDIIIIDSSDPVGPAEGLFNHEFYQAVFHTLKKDGMLISQSESPFYVMEYFKDTVKNIRSVFPLFKVLTAPVPDYPFGLWTFTIGSKEYDPVGDFKKDKFIKYNLSTQFYNHKIHFSSFTLPNFIKDVIK